MGQREKPAKAGFSFQELTAIGVLLALDTGAKLLPKIPLAYARNTIFSKDILIT